MNELTLFKIKNQLERRLAMIASETGIAARIIANFADCQASTLVEVISNGDLPGYRILLLPDFNYERVVLDPDFMYSFTNALYCMEMYEMTPAQKLQWQVARILNTSVADAKSAVLNADTPILALYLARAITDRKTLQRLLTAEINRRERR